MHTTIISNSNQTLTKEVNRDEVWLTLTRKTASFFGSVVKTHTVISNPASFNFEACPENLRGPAGQLIDYMTTRLQKDSSLGIFDNPQRRIDKLSIANEVLLAISPPTEMSILPGKKQKMQSEGSADNASNQANLERKTQTVGANIALLLKLHERASESLLPGKLPKIIYDLRLVLDPEFLQQQRMDIFIPSLV